MVRNVQQINVLSAFTEQKHVNRSKNICVTEYTNRYLVSWMQRPWYLGFIICYFIIFLGFLLLTCVCQVVFGYTMAPKDWQTEVVIHIHKKEIRRKSN